MWWLKNQALPSTQARLASMMWLSFTVRSMSSHTQPQNVQVASSMTVTDGSTGLVTSSAHMSLTQLLRG